MIVEERQKSTPGDIMKSCENCCREIEEDYEFCPYCGHGQNLLRELDGEIDEET